MSSSNIFLNILKVVLQYLFNAFILFNTVSYLKLDFKLKIEPKMYSFKNQEVIWKTWKNFERTSGNPDNKKSSIQFYFMIKLKYMYIKHCTHIL